MTGGEDYLAGTAPGTADDAVDPNVVPVDPALGAGPSGEGPQRRRDAAEAAGEQRAADKNTVQADVMEGLDAMFDKPFARSLGESTDPVDIDRRVGTDEFINWWNEPVDPDNEDQVRTRNTYGKEIVWKLRNMLEQNPTDLFWGGGTHRPSSETGVPIATLKEMMAEIEGLDLEDPSNAEEINKWVSNYAMMAKNREDLRKPRTAARNIEPAPMPAMGY